MSIELKVPGFPEYVSDGTVLNWNKKPGDSVKRDESIVDIEEKVAAFDAVVSVDFNSFGEPELYGGLHAERVTVSGRIHVANICRCPVDPHTSLRSGELVRGHGDTESERE